MKNSITICLLSAVLLACSHIGYSQWSPLISGTTEYLHSIYFKDAQNGFCAGGGDVWAYSVNGTTGVILKTTDGGANWNTVYDDTLIAMHAVIALHDTVTAFGTDEFGQWISMRSVNDGYSWVKDTIPYLVTDLCYYNNELYFIDDSSGGELKKIHEGTIQSVQPDALLFDINGSGDIFCITYSATAGFYYDLLVSEDDGASWDTMHVDAPIITFNSLTHASLWSFGDTVVFYATYPTAIAYSYNKGASWTYFNAPSNAPAGGAFVLSANIIIGSSYPTHILGSGNGGYVFSIQDSTTARVSQFHFVDGQTGYLCGEDGIIYKTTNAGGATAIRALERQLDGLTVYPNPVKDVVTVAYPKGIEIERLRLVDVRGRELFSKNGAVNEISLKQLPPGNYFLVLTTSIGQIVKQVVK